MLLLQCILSLIWELDGSSQQHFSYLDKWMTFLIIRKKKKGLLNSENKKRREMLVIFLTLSCLLLHRWFLYWGISFTSIIVKPKSAQSRGPGIWLLYWIDLFTDTVYLNFFFFISVLFWICIIILLLILNRSLIPLSRLRMFFLENTKVLLTSLKFVKRWIESTCTSVYKVDIIWWSWTGTLTYMYITTAAVEQND